MERHDYSHPERTEDQRQEKERKAVSNVLEEFGEQIWGSNSIKINNGCKEARMAESYEREQAVFYYSLFLQ